MKPPALLSKLRERFSMKTMKVIKETEPTRMTKQEAQEAKPGELIELDQDTIKLVKMRFEYTLALFFFFFCWSSRSRG